MKKFKILFISILIASCKIFTPEQKQDILTTQDAVCALTNWFMPNEKIQTVCHITDQVMPAIVELLSAHRQNIAREREAVLANKSDPCNIKGPQ